MQSTTNLMAKRPYDYSNQDFYDLLKDKIKLYNNEPRENSNDIIESSPYWSYHLTNKVFYWILQGGAERISEPTDLHLSLDKYSSFTLEMWDYQEMSEEEMKVAEFPSEKKYVLPGLGDFWIKVNYQIWPYKEIDPGSDDRFKDFEWAKSFKRGPWTSAALLPANTVFDIIRYCDKISGLKAFW